MWPQHTVDAFGCFTVYYDITPSSMAVELDNLSKQELVQVALEISVVFGAWGRRLSTQDLIQEFPGISQKEHMTVLNAGFTYRHLPFEPTPFLENREATGRIMSEIGARLGRQALAANNWKGADHIYVATSAAPDIGGKWAEEIANLTNSRSLHLSYLACNGGGAALLDSLKREEFYGQVILIVAVDPLGYLANPKNLTHLAVFGNGAAALAYRSGSIRLLTGKTIIERDEEGVICPPKTYDLPPVEERVKIPDWYEVRKGGEEVFACSGKGAFMLLPEQNGQDPYLQMDGKKTGLYFKYLAANALLETLTTYYGDVLRDKYRRSLEECSEGLDPVLPEEHLIRLCLSHQPSGVVGRQVEKELNKQLDLRKMPSVESPWVMDKVEMANSSSPTSLIAFAKGAPGLRDNERFLFGSYGVGASVTTFVAQIAQ